MEIIGKISKGSKMDQIYLPKNRFGLNPGSHVLVKEISHKKEEKLFYYNIKKIEKVKIIIIKELFKLYEGMSLKGSTIEERHEIWKLLFSKNLLYSQAENVDLELIILNKQSFYFEDDENLFVVDFMGVGVIDIPFGILAPSIGFS